MIIKKTLHPNFDLTIEHQNSPDRMSPTTDQRQTSIQQYLETDKSNSHNDKNEGDIPSRTPISAVKNRIEHVIEALDDISSARSIIIHVGIDNIKVREESAEDIFPRYEEMVNKALGNQKTRKRERVRLNTQDSTNYRGRTNYNYNHRFRNTGYNKSHQYKSADTWRPLYNNNWYTHDTNTELGHYRNTYTRKTFDYDNSYMYDTDGEVNLYRNDDNRTSEYNQSYRHETDRDLS
ncbi:unnamed protein product [Mytilus coruscus]|uniref:Uncharacterized protein n=1 Tax=Mytilus coruscus TaxID=42192 RepID=A0A6J8AMR8_MYTCO|nr:unnamed protein product [Mytilus coruscus]